MQKLEDLLFTLSVGPTNETLAFDAGKFLHRTDVDGISVHAGSNNKSDLSVQRDAMETRIART